MTKDQFIFEMLEMGCWHDIAAVSDSYKIRCAICGAGGIYLSNPDFTTWEGFGKLWEMAKEKEWFNAFKWEPPTEEKDNDTISYNLIHPTRFRDAVAGFLGWEEE